MTRFDIIQLLLFIISAVKSSRVIPFFNFFLISLVNYLKSKAEAKPSYEPEPSSNTLDASVLFFRLGTFSKTKRSSSNKK